MKYFLQKAVQCNYGHCKRKLLQVDTNTALLQEDEGVTGCQFFTGKQYRQAGLR